jgi:hypothetical protein
MKHRTTGTGNTFLLPIIPLTWISLYSSVHIINPLEYLGKYEMVRYPIFGFIYRVAVISG